MLLEDSSMGCFTFEIGLTAFELPTFEVQKMQHNAKMGGEKEEKAEHFSSDMGL